MRVALEEAIGASESLRERVVEQPIVVPVAEAGDRDSEIIEQPAPAPRTVPASTARRPFASNVLAWAAMALAAVLAVGYAISLINTPAELETGSTQDAPTESANTQVSEETENAGIVEPDTSPEPVDSAPQQTDVAIGKVPSVPKPEPQRQPAKSATDEPVEFEEIDGELVPVSSAPRRRLTNRRNAPTVERPRRVRERRISSEEPVSSIEMIFTGVPRDRQRRRRYQPE
jgi:hypothetical protein